MTESELAKLLAKRLGTSSSRAAEQVDRVVHEILKKLRSGTPATLPGLGKLVPSPESKNRPGARKRS